MLLNVLARGGEPVRGHAAPAHRQPRGPRRQRRHIRRAIAIYRALRAGGVVEPLATPDEEGGWSGSPSICSGTSRLNQPLSPLGARPRSSCWIRESPSYALDVVSVIESILDDPRQVLSAQQFRAKGEAVAQMKADGIEYDQRMDLLEEVTHPKPLADLLDAAYELYRRGHPWVADHALSPKSVVRDMYERALTFVEYVGFYSLARSEGLVLRYLADRLPRPAPERARGRPHRGAGRPHRVAGRAGPQVDSSLIDEWERLRNPACLGRGRGGGVGREAARGHRNVRAFRVLVRNALFHRVGLAALRRYDELGELDAEAGWDAEAWAAALEPYFDEYGELGIGPDARGPAMLMIETGPRTWRVRQIFDDPDGDQDWGISAEVDLAESDAAGSAVVRVLDVGPALATRRVAEFSGNS
jgi:hypothetical protein